MSRAVTARAGKHVFPGDGWGPIAVPTSPQMRTLLARLTQRGLHGQTLEETASMVLAEYLRHEIVEKRL